jgi:tagaturonate reductase
LLALGFAAYLLFMKPVKEENGKYYGQRGEEFYLIQDDQAAYYYALWQNENLAGLVKQVLQNQSLWGADLTQVSGFEQKVGDFLHHLIHTGAKETLATTLQQERVEV